MNYPKASNYPYVFLSLAKFYWVIAGRFSRIATYMKGHGRFLLFTFVVVKDSCRVVIDGQN